jgi:hypothetical protein
MFQKQKNTCKNNETQTMCLEFYILSSSFMLYFQLSNIPQNDLMEKMNSNPCSNLDLPWLVFNIPWYVLVCPSH